MKDNLSDKLKSMIKSLEEMTDILNKSVDTNEHVSRVNLSKRIEDGILDNIHNADNHQLNHILNSYQFRYYTDFNKNKELLKSEITKRLRDNKLNKIL